MWKILSILAVLGVAIADPAKPELPSQYSVTNIQLHMDTNAGYPPHYDETDSAMYFDLEKQASRTDVEKASYGNPGPYTMIKNYAETFPVDCGHAGEFQAPKGYLVEKDKNGNTQCCYTMLIQDCPPGPQEMPMPDTILAPQMPQMVKYDGEVNSDAVSGGVTADLWESNVMLKQSVPFMTQDFYFSTEDHSTQLANFLAIYIEGNGQFINATTTYADGVDGWKTGPQDASLFDVSAYDCSAMCSSSVSEKFFLSANAQSKTAKKLTRSKVVTPTAPIKDGDCSQCTGSGPCAQCAACVDMKDGPCAPCWSSDNAEGTACLPACESCYSANTYANKAKKAVKSGSCEAITSESTCMSSSEGDEACAWCSSGAVGASCQKTSDAQALPSSIFECEYQTAYAAYTTEKVTEPAAMDKTPYAPY